MECFPLLLLNQIYFAVPQHAIKLPIHGYFNIHKLGDSHAIILEKPVTYLALFKVSIIGRWGFT